MHVAFTRFLRLLKENNVEDLNLEYLGNLFNEEPLLHVYGGGLAHMYGNNPPACACVHLT